jgi:hypothetical protein
MLVRRVGVSCESVHSSASMSPTSPYSTAIVLLRNGLELREGFPDVEAKRCGYARGWSAAPTWLSSCPNWA